MFDLLVDGTTRLRDDTAAALLQHAAQGVPNFDQQYRQIAGSNPPRYETPYDQKVEAQPQALYHTILARLDGCLYALAVDNKGCAPAHSRVGFDSKRLC